MPSTYCVHVLVLILYTARFSGGDLLDYSYHDVRYGDPASPEEMDDDILEVLDTLDYKDQADMAKYNQVLDDILGQEVMEDKLRSDFDSMMEGALLQDLSLARDKNGALRFKDYILAEKSRIIKKTLPDDQEDAEWSDVDVLKADTDYQLEDQPDQPADELAQPADESAQPLEESAQQVYDLVEPADELAEPAPKSVQQAEEPAEPADAEYHLASSEEQQEENNYHDLIGNSSGEDKLLAFEISYGLVRVGEVKVEDVPKIDDKEGEEYVYDAFENIVELQDQGPLVIEDDGLTENSQLRERILEGLYELESQQNSQDRAESRDTQPKSVYFESLGKEVRILEAVFYIGLCGGVILLVFGWLACILGLLRVRRTMEAQRRQEDKLNQVRSVKVGSIIKNYARLPLDIKTGRPNQLAYSELYNIA